MISAKQFKQTFVHIRLSLISYLTVSTLLACQTGTVLTPTIDEGIVRNAVVATVAAQLTKDATPSLSLTDTPWPTFTPFPPEIIFLQGETPSFITGKSSLPVVPGTYLLHENPSTYGLAYTSLDGLNRGTLLNYKNISRGSSFSPQLFMMSSAESPKLIFTHLEDNEIDIWATNLVGNLLKSWHTQVTFDAGSECYAPWIPSDGHWLVLECGPENKNLTYFVDLNSANEEIISPGLDCGVGYNDVKSSFPYGEAEWLLWCDKPQEYCFLSRLENKKLCLDLSKVINSSPANQSKEVVVEGDMLHGSDGTVPGTRIVVFDRACLLKQTPCGPS